MIKSIKKKLGKNKKKSMTSTMLFTVLTIMTLFIFLLGATWIYDTTNILRQDTKDLEIVQKNYIELDLVTRVESVIDYISYRKTQAEDALKENLKSRTNEAYEIMLSIYQENAGKKSKSEITKMIVNALENIRFNNGRGYYFIDSLNGDVILYPINSKSQGTNLLDLQDDNGNYVLKKEIDLVKNKREGFVEGYWKKPSVHDLKKYRKITFVKLFEPYNWYLGCGDYIDVFNEKTKNEILNYVSHLRYGKNNSQYIFIHDYKGKELANGLYPELIGENNYDLEDIHGIKVIQEQIQTAKEFGKGFLTHYWKNLDTIGQYEKRTYIENFPEWEWVVGTGISMDYINKSILEKEKTLKENVKDKIIYIILFLVVMVGISLFIVKIYISTIVKSIDVFTSFMRSSSAHLKVIDIEQVGYNDFDELIDVTNSMTNRINYLLFHDELTGIFNRRFIGDKLNKLLKDVRVKELCVILLDIDHFKFVNDTYGHDKGDLVLKRISKIIENKLDELSVKDEFYIGRFGGEEFLVLLSNTSKKKGKKIVESILFLVENEKIEGITEPITISAGLVCSKDLSGDELMKIADEKLYKAKEGGRNQLVV